MSTFQDLLDFVTPLAPADQVKEMVTLLKKEDKQYLFKYGTVEEIIAFPHQQLQNRAKLQYHLFIKMIFEEASKRGVCGFCGIFGRSSQILEYQLISGLFKK